MHMNDRNRLVHYRLHVCVHWPALCLHWLSVCLFTHSAWAYNPKSGISEYCSKDCFNPKSDSGLENCLRQNLEHTNVGCMLHNESTGLAPICQVTKCVCFPADSYEKLGQKFNSHVYQTNLSIPHAHTPWVGSHRAKLVSVCGPSKLLLWLISRTKAKSHGFSHA